MMHPPATFCASGVIAGSPVLPVGWLALNHRRFASSRVAVGSALEECKWGRPAYAVKHRSAPLKASKQGETTPDTLKPVVMKKDETPSVVLAPDFRLGLSVLAVGLQLWKVLNWTTLGIIVSVIGGFLTLQTARLRFRFTNTALDVLRVKGLSDTGDDDAPTVEAESTDVGGTGCAIRETKRAIGPWKFSSVVNWEFWWPGFPVLAYFQETQVKETGQRHFLPIIMDGKGLYEQMMLHFGPTSTPKPKVEEWKELQPLHPRGYRLYKQKLWARWVKIENRLQLQAKIALAKSMVQGMLDPARREATMQQLKVVWGEFKAWAEEFVRDASSAIKQMMQGKPTGK